MAMAMAMASFKASFISHRLSPLLLPFLLSSRPRTRHWFVLSGGLLQLHRHSSPASSSSSCRKQTQLAPGIDAEEVGGAEQLGKKVTVARRRQSAAPKAPRPSAPKKPTKGRPAKPGGPKEGSGGNGGVVHAAPAYSPTASSSSSSRGDDKKVE